VYGLDGSRGHQNGATFVTDFMACRLEGDTLRRVAAEPPAN
jgi:hypothetical protein